MVDETEKTLTIVATMLVIGDYLIKIGKWLKLRARKRKRLKPKRK